MDAFRCNPLFGTNPPQLARPYCLYRLENRRYKRVQMDHAVRVCQNQEDAQLKPRNVLLEFEVAIHCYQYLETPLRAVQKFAVLDTSPAQTGNGGDLVTHQLRG